MARKLRVIIAVTNNLVTDHRVSKMAGYLESKGYEVFLAGRRWPGGELPDGRPGKVFRFRILFNKGPFFYLFINIRLFLFLMFHRCNKIVAVDLDTLLAANVAGYLKRIPVIFDSHEYFPEIPELQHRPKIKKVWERLEGVLVPHIAAGITVSSGIADIYRNKYKKDFSLVRNIPSSMGDVFRIRARVENPVIYYQGALNLGRGLAESIRALSLLPGYRMVIVGTGDIEEELKVLAVELGLNDRILFTGKLPFEKLIEYGKDAHVGLCLLENIGLNYYHSLPNRLFDYPRMGLPVIATDFPDISEFVNRYNTGILLNSLKPEHIAEAVKKACENDELRNLWRDTLHEAASLLIWENEVKKLDHIF